MSVCLFYMPCLSVDLSVCLPMSGDCVCIPPYEGDGQDCSVSPTSAPCDLVCSLISGVRAECVLGDDGPYCVSEGLGDLQNQVLATVCAEMCRDMFENFTAVCLSVSLSVQLSALLEEPSRDPGLRAFTGQLAAAAASDLRLSGDITLLVDLVLQSLTLSNVSQLSVDSYQVSQTQLWGPAGLQSPPCPCLQNLVTTVSELFDTSKHSVWSNLNQVCVTSGFLLFIPPSSNLSLSLQTQQPELVLRLLMGLDIVGQQLFLQTNASSSRVVLSADNVGKHSLCLQALSHCHEATPPPSPSLCAAVVVIRPGCGSNGSDITVSSDILGGDPDNFITLPASVFGPDSDCMEVGVVVVIYDGVGPLLSADNLLPTCESPTAALANGQW